VGDPTSKPHARWFDEIMPTIATVDRLMPHAHIVIT
jgi:hypothetical protein